MTVSITAASERRSMLRLCKVGIAMQAAWLAQKKPRLLGACLLLGGTQHQEVATIMHSGANFAKLREYRYRRFARGAAIRHGK